MREFFKGWRRKAAFVALAMACAGMAALVRSLMLCSAFQFRLNGNSVCRLIVNNGSVSIERFVSDGDCDSEDFDSDFQAMDFMSTMFFTDTPSFRSYPSQRNDDFPRRNEYWNRGGILVADWQSDRGGHRKSWVTISILPANLVLTLFSAYLILWKPRKQTGPDHA
jgi:hypothetical protein